ncbi:MAG: alpha/beta hydrolase [Rhodobacteraceae bacterium]|nr:alpha/beta hydrolase [Paracoccaceae bacterium]
MTDLLWTHADAPKATLLLAHGAGTAMDSTFMEKIANHLASNDVSVVRFEFAYMAGRRTGGSKRPPPKAEKLIGEFQTALQAILQTCEGPVLIGGKSMGGRVAAMLAGGASLPARAKGVVCLGYPFHKVSKEVTDSDWRLEPLEESKRPVLILQGERDQFGSQAELAGMSLPETVTVSYLEDGNHDFGPRGRSPATLDGNIENAAKLIAEFAEGLQ